MVLFQNGVRQLHSPAKMATTVQFRCYWKQLWSRWAITGSWEPLVYFINTPKVSTHYGEYSYAVSWSLMKEIKKKNPPYLFPWQLRQSLSNRFWFFWAYLVPLDVRRVTCYDPFCVFQFFSILAVSMATAVNLNKINPSQHNFTWHMIFLQGFIKFDQGISEKLSGQKCVEE